MSDSFNYVPHYIRQPLDYKKGQMVTAADFNASINTLIVATDNNTTALKEILSADGTAVIKEATHAATADYATLAGGLTGYVVTQSTAPSDNNLPDSNNAIPTALFVKRHVGRIRDDLSATMVQEIDTLTASGLATKTALTNFQASTATNFSTLQGTVNSNKSAIESRVATTERNIASNTSRISTLEGKAADAASNITLAQADITSLKSRVSALEPRMTAVESQATNNKNNIASHATEITSIKTVNTTQSNNIAALQTLTGSHTSSLSTHTDNIASLNGELTAVKGRATTLEGKVTSLETLTGGHTTSINSLTTKQSTLETTLNGHTTTLSNHAALIASNTASINALDPAGSAELMKQIGGRNLLVNGGFDVWSNGTSGSISSSGGITTYCDMWTNRSSYTRLVNYERVTNTAPIDTPYAIKLTKVEGSIDLSLQQTITNIDYYNGKTLTFSVYAKPSKTIRIQQYIFGSVVTHAYVSGGVWTKLLCTVTVPTTATDLGIYTYTSGLTATGDYVEYSGMKLEYGSIATPFVAKSYNQELLDCNQYYTSSQVDDKISVLSNPNLLLNGGFDIWQDGTEVTLGTAKGFICDMWDNNTFSYGNVLCQRVANTSSANTPYALKLTRKTTNAIASGTFGQGCIILQRFNDVTLFAGKKVVLSGYINASKDTRLVSGILGRQGTTINITSDTWTYFELPVTLAVSVTEPTVYIFTPDTNSLGDTVLYAGIKLELGNLATPFVPKSYAQELADCQRYYLPLAVTSNTEFVVPATCYVGGYGGSYNVTVPLPTQMRTTPTLIVSNVEYYSGAWQSGATLTQNTGQGSTQMRNLTLTLPINDCAVYGESTLVRAKIAFDARLY